MGLQEQRLKDQTKRSDIGPNPVARYTLDQLATARLRSLAAKVSDL
ncbi:MAG TPA: hypothetical protein VJ044_03250 [Candidatus Hodarchaeales archaeon]|nr:hypothetical protein [Candidatus Hodarchaeales archaeon]